MVSFTIPSEADTHEWTSDGVQLDGNGRPRIKTPDGKLRSYTRCTTFIDSLGDKKVLEKWKQRIILIGLQRDAALRAELWLIDPDDKQALNDLAERAFQAGDGYLKAQQGTDWHKMAEQWDLGQQLDPTPVNIADEQFLQTYLATCQRLNLEWLMREKRIVVDHLKVTGTPDGICRYKALNGKWYNVIADLKTGRVDIDPGKIAQQMAVYAQGVLYKPGSDEHPFGIREHLPGVSRDIGLLIHIDQADPSVASVYEVNLRIGLAGVGLSSQVREWRNYSKKVYQEVPLP